MITLNISDTLFMKVGCDEANNWMDKNIGMLIHDDPELTYGEGWRIVYRPDNGDLDWVLEFEEEHHAVLFLLRWS